MFFWSNVHGIGSANHKNALKQIYKNIDKTITRYLNVSSEYKVPNFLMSGAHVAALRPKDE